MELLLNLLWLTLALPALWVWRRAPATAAAPRTLRRCRTLVILSCLLWLLFPVISVSDDLQAMQSEIEECTLSKRAVRQPSGNSFNGPWPLGDGFFMPNAAPFVLPGGEICGMVTLGYPLVHQQSSSRPPASRAPPHSCLG